MSGSERSKDELWSVAESATTLGEARDAVMLVAASGMGSFAQWGVFGLRAAMVYRRVAEIDVERRGEALLLAEGHRERAEAIAAVLSSGPARGGTDGVERAPGSRASVPSGEVLPQYTVRLRGDTFAKAMRLAAFRSDYALAKAMGLHRSTVARVRAGELRPGPRFISGALTALAPFDFEDLFEVESLFEVGTQE